MWSFTSRLLSRPGPLLHFWNNARIPWCGHYAGEQFFAWLSRERGVCSVRTPHRQRPHQGPPARRRNGSAGHRRADLPAVFRGLALLGYRGDYVLQIARSDSGEELKWIARNRARVAAEIVAAWVVQ